MKTRVASIRHQRSQTWSILDRQVDTKGGPLPYLATGRDGAPVIGHHLLADGQANACSRVLAFAMQPLKHLTNTIYILFLKANVSVTSIQ